MTTLDPSHLPPHFLTPPDQGGLDPNSGEIEQIKQRALRCAEQLSNVYLDEADSANDHSSMSLRKNFPLNPSSGSPACAISPRHAPRREKSSLIHDDQGCFSEIHQSFFFGDGLGFFCFHVGYDRE